MKKLNINFIVLVIIIVLSFTAGGLFWPVANATLQDDKITAGAIDASDTLSWIELYKYTPEEGKQIEVRISYDHILGWKSVFTEIDTETGKSEIIGQKRINDGFTDSVENCGYMAFQFGFMCLGTD